MLGKERGAQSQMTYAKRDGPVLSVVRAAEFRRRRTNRQNAFRVSQRRRSLCWITRRLRQDAALSVESASGFSVTKPPDEGSSKYLIKHSFLSSSLPRSDGSVAPATPDRIKRIDRTFVRPSSATPQE